MKKSFLFTTEYVNVGKVKRERSRTEVQKKWSAARCRIEDKILQLLYHIRPCWNSRKTTYLSKEEPVAMFTDKERELISELRKMMFESSMGALAEEPEEEG